VLGLAADAVPQPAQNFMLAAKPPPHSPQKELKPLTVAVSVLLIGLPDRTVE
jgi:hypothetical protein